MPRRAQASAIKYVRSTYHGWIRGAAAGRLTLHSRFASGCCTSRRAKGALTYGKMHGEGREGGRDWLCYVVDTVFCTQTASLLNPTVPTNSNSTWILPLWARDTARGIPWVKAFGETIMRERKVETLERNGCEIFEEGEGAEEEKKKVQYLNFYDPPPPPPEKNRALENGANSTIAYKALIGRRKCFNIYVALIGQKIF